MTKEYLTPEDMTLTLNLLPYEDEPFIHINRGRQSGHTTTMLACANKDDVIVVYNTFQRNHILSSPTSVDENKVISYTSNIGRLRGRRMTTRYIWLDDFSAAKNAYKLDNVFWYELVLVTGAKGIIALG